MSTEDKNVVQEIFARILKKLGEMGDFFTVAAELSKPGSASHSKLISWLLTRSEYANLKAKYSDEKFFTLMAQLADLDRVHERAGLPAATKPSAQVKRLLADENLQRLVLSIADADNELYSTMERLAALDKEDVLIQRLANDEPPILSTLQLLAKHPEIDGLLATQLRLLANDEETHILPDDEDFARLVIDLANSEAVNDPLRREQFFDLIRGFGAESESQELARKILFSARFPQVASRLSQDEELTNVVRRMQDDEHHKRVADMLKAGGDSAQVILSVAEDPEMAETIKRMCEDKVDPNGFNNLIKRLRNNGDHFFDQVKQLSEDELFREIHSTLPEGPLTAEKFALLLNKLGGKLFEGGKYDRALTSYKLALALDPLLRDAYLGHAETCIAKGFLTMAVEDYGTLITKNEHDTTAYLKRGYAYLMAAMYDEAKADFHKVLDLSIDDAERTKADDGLAKVARMQR